MLGMIQRGDSPSLALEAFAELFLGDLDRDDAIESRIAGFVNLAHAAGAMGARTS